MISNIVLALDDSQRAPRVAAVGALLATRFGAMLHPVRVLPVRAGVSTSEAASDHVLNEATQALIELTRPFMDALVATPRVRVGEPWRVLVELAAEQNVEVIVMGTRGHGSEPVGATALAVLAHAAQDVFLVRDHSRRSVAP